MRKIANVLVCLLCPLIWITCNRPSARDDFPGIEPRAVSLAQQAPHAGHWALEKEWDLEERKIFLPWFPGEEILLLSMRGKDTFLACRGAEMQPKWQVTLRYGQGPMEVLSSRFFGGNEQEYLIYEYRTQRFHLYRNRFRSREEVGRAQWAYSVLDPVAGQAYDPVKKRAFLILQRGIDKDRDHVLVKRLDFSGPSYAEKDIYARTYRSRDKRGRSFVADPVQVLCWHDGLYILERDRLRLLHLDPDGRGLQVVLESHLATRDCSAEDRKTFFAHSTLLKSDEWALPEIWPLAWLWPAGERLVIGLRENYQEQTGDWLDVAWVDGALLPLGRGQVPLSTRLLARHPNVSPIGRYHTCPDGSLLVLTEKGAGEGDGDQHVLQRWRFRP